MPSRPIYWEFDLQLDVVGSTQFAADDAFAEIAATEEQLQFAADDGPAADQDGAALDDEHAVHYQYSRMVVKFVTIVRQ